MPPESSPNPWTPDQHSFLLCPRTHILMCECPCCRAHAEREVARHNARVQAATPLFPDAFPEMLWTVEGRIASQYNYWRRLERAIYKRDPDETEAQIRALTSDS